MGVMTRLGLMLAVFCWGANAQASVLAAWEKTQQFNAEFQMARADRDFSAEFGPLALSALLPQATAQASYGRAGSDISTNGGATSREQFYDTRNWALQLRQPLFRYRAIRGYVQGGLQVEAAEASYEDARQQLALRLVESLGRLAAAQAGLRQAEAEQSAADLVLEQSQRQLSAGEKTQTDRSRAARRKAQAATAVSQAQMNLAAARSNWQQLTGEPSPRELDIGIEPAGFTLPEGSTPESLMDMARSQSPALLARQRERDVAREELRKVKGDRLPAVDLLISRGYSESDVESNIGNRYLTNRVAVQASLPLYTGGQLGALERQAEARLARAEAAVSVAEAVIKAILDTEIAGLDLARHQAEGARSSLEAAQIALRAADLGRAGGVSTLGDRSDAESAVAAAHRDVVLARAQALISWARIRQAVGTIDDAALRFLDVGIHLD